MREQRQAGGQCRRKFAWPSSRECCFSKLKTLHAHISADRLPRQILRYSAHRAVTVCPATVWWLRATAHWTRPKHQWCSGMWRQPARGQGGVYTPCYWQGCRKCAPPLSRVGGPGLTTAPRGGVQGSLRRAGLHLGEVRSCLALLAASTRGPRMFLSSGLE